jgi:hypothetical protein
MTRLALGVLAILLLGCSTEKIPPPYTQDELRQRCESRDGRWHADPLHGNGFCEYDSMQ